MPLSLIYIFFYANNYNVSKQVQPLKIIIVESKNDFFSFNHFLIIHRNTYVNGKYVA